MKALCFESFGGTPFVTQVPDPTPDADSVIVQVGATGLCRSDWWGWKGFDSSMELPHVPGHEFAGRIVATGRNVSRFRVGERVTVPFVTACGGCDECHSGNQQVCSHQAQPGFTHWGSFAEYVAVHFADANLVRLPDNLPDATAASLGCRFATSFRGVVDQARTRAGEWVAVHGCGGVGLSAVMIASALGANVIAIDVEEEKLALARACGAAATINSRQVTDVVEAVREITGGGAHVSLDAVGHQQTCFDSIRNLRRRGRHVQIGLMHSAEQIAQIPMGQVIGHELEIYGSHGMQAWRYDAMISMIASGRLAPERLIGDFITLEQAAEALTTMDEPQQGAGIKIISLS